MNPTVRAVAHPQACASRDARGWCYFAAEVAGVEALDEADSDFLAGAGVLLVSDEVEESEVEASDLGVAGASDELVVERLSLR